MKNISAGLFVLCSFLLHAQDDQKDPKATEVWEPQPQKVTPGEIPSQPPSDAIILFDGTDFSAWQNAEGKKVDWELDAGAMTVVKGTGAISTKQEFDDIQLHIEWRTPAEVSGNGQGRGNSGIFLMERYELQVLDSYDNETYANGMAGSIYKQHIPLVNASKGPGQWQTYDVIFRAPRFGDDGRMLIPATITVLHNGVLIQNETQIWGPTQYRGLPVYEAHGKASIVLQDHGNPVSYRNIWVREL